MSEAKIEHELKLINAKLSQMDMATKTIDGWLLRKRLMVFLDIAETTMSALENTGALKISKIGRRTFYSVASVAELLKNNIVTK